MAMAMGHGPWAMGHGPWAMGHGPRPAAKASRQGHNPQPWPWLAAMTWPWHEAMAMDMPGSHGRDQTPGKEFIVCSFCDIVRFLW